MDMQTYLPLSEVTYFILLSLAYERKHGYAIMKEVELLSDGRVIMSTGTLYGALKRLLDQEWIIRSNKDSEKSSGREKKVYSLTSLGTRILNAEIRRLESLVNVAHLKTTEERST
jgi:DNA-binding PadR family transcriptional regulator